jgi:hypothetical protein
VKYAGESRVVVVRSVSEVSVLHRNPIGPGRTRVVLEIPQLLPDQSLLWQERLNRRFSECGCTAGGITALLGLVGAVVWQFSHSGWSVSSWPGFLIRAVLLMLAGGFVGKLMGIERARWQIRTLTAQIRRLTAVEGSPMDTSHGHL